MRRKLSDGQVSLIGEIYNSKCKFPPHISTDKTTGLSVIVYRVPAGQHMSLLDELETKNEVIRLRGEITTTPKRNYYFKRHRDAETKEMIRKLKPLHEMSNDENSTTLFN